MTKINYQTSDGFTQDVYEKQLKINYRKSEKVRRKRLKDCFQLKLVKFFICITLKSQLKTIQSSSQIEIKSDFI